jgi:NAD(P)-dependent dehydrogenase (short-subunit alcohol dehydrogenase family)
VPIGRHAFLQVVCLFSCFPYNVDLHCEMLKGILRSRSLVLPLAGSCVKRHRGKQGKNGVKQDQRDKPHGPFLLTWAVLPYMIARHSGVINNTASESNLHGGTGGPVYTTSKRGLVGLARTWMMHYRLPAQVSHPSRCSSFQESHTANY